MANHARNGHRAAASSLAAIALVLALPAAADANSILIGEFYFDRPFIDVGITDPAIHLTNISDPPQTFDFTITFDNLVEFVDQGTGDVTCSETFSGALSAGASFQESAIASGGCVPAGSTLTPGRAELTQFAVSLAGAISFKGEDGSLVDGAVLDLTLDEQFLTIWFMPDTPVGVPEASTLLFVTSGVMAGLVARTSRRLRKHP